MGCAHSRASVFDEDSFFPLVTKETPITEPSTSWDVHFENFMFSHCSKMDRTKYVSISTLIAAFGHYLTVAEKKYFQNMCNCEHKKHAIEYAEGIIYRMIHSKILETTPGFIIKQDFERYPKYDTRLILGIDLVSLPVES